ncbi:hypothetical protein FHX96_001807 [Clostridium tetanomorphum]|nr:hypothetical protein [Clostridium tetanomorphum]
MGCKSRLELYPLKRGILPTEQFNVLAESVG